MSLRTVLSLATLSFLALNSVSSTSVTGYNVFESKILVNHTLRYVNDSGICETTPGVHQVSGYLDIGKNQSMVRLYWCYRSSRRLYRGFLQWFWFFEARNSPEKAPFTLWSKDSRFLMQLHSSIDVIPFSSKRRSGLQLDDWTWAAIVLFIDWSKLTPLSSCTLVFQGNVYQSHSSTFANLNFRKWPLQCQSGWTEYYN